MKWAQYDKAWHLEIKETVGYKNGDRLGQHTTLSVVQALFLVIVIDAFFAMFYLEIDF